MIEPPTDVVVGITGASGVAIGVRVLELLQRDPGVRAHVVVSKAGAMTLQQECPEMWNELTPTERTGLISQVENVAVGLMASPPWPQPDTTDHLAVVAYHQQVRTWAIENAMASEIYEVWPVPEEDDDEEIPVVAELLKAQVEMQEFWAQELADLDRELAALDHEEQNEAPA